MLVALQKFWNSHNNCALVKREQCCLHGSELQILGKEWPSGSLCRTWSGWGKVLSSLPGVSVIIRDVRDEALGFFYTLFGFLFFQPLGKCVLSLVKALGYVKCFLSWQLPAVLHLWKDSWPGIWFSRRLWFPSLKIQVFWDNDTTGIIFHAFLYTVLTDILQIL